MKQRFFHLILLFGLLAALFPAASPVISVPAAPTLTEDQIIDQVMSLSAITASDLQTELQSLVQQLVNDPNNYSGIGYNFIKANPTILHLRGTTVSTLAMLIPLLPGPLSDANSLQAKLASRLKTEVTSYLLNSQYWDWEQATANVPSATYLVPANPNVKIGWTHKWPGGPHWEKLHALWAYAYYTGDWTTISNNWNSFIKAKCTGGDTDSTHQRAVLIASREAVYREDTNDLANGLIGCVRMAVHLNDTTTANSLRPKARSALGYVLNRLNVSWSASPVEIGWDKTATIRGEWSPGYNLTPELGRWINDQARVTAQTRLDEAATSGNLNGHWFGGYLNNSYRGGLKSGFYDEDYSGMPNLSHELFQGRAWMLLESGDSLRVARPWHVVMGRTPEYRDMLYLRSLYALISRYATVTWVNAN
jgi:hypothetical protein